MNLYKEEILDLYRHPVNYGTIEKPDLDVYEINPACGDAVRLQACLKEGVIEEIKFVGNGCAISQAFTSTLTEMVRGKNLAFAKEISEQNLFSKLGINPSLQRVKCATLGLKALRKGLDQLVQKL